MTSTLDSRLPVPVDAATYFRTLTNADFLAKKLAAIGGEGAAVLECSQSTLRTQYGIAADQLPSAVRSLAGTGLRITRIENWSSATQATVTVEIANVPAQLQGTLALAETPDGNGLSELIVTLAVSVNIPFLGRKLEGLIIEQLEKLLAAEEKFTVDWLATHE
jgi:hypothetical protein